MKLNAFLVGFILLAIFSMPGTAMAETKYYEGSGEVDTVDPAYGRITIEHGAITDFAGPGTTEFTATVPDDLKDLSRRDLVVFSIVEENGDARIGKISKVGQAPEKRDHEPLGNVVQGALESTGDAVKTVTSPIAPAHEMVSGAMDATTNATGSVLEDNDSAVTAKF